MNRFYFLTAGAVIITINLWLGAKSGLSEITGNPLLALSQILGLIGLVFMSINLLLSTRLNMIERVFFGLDKVYKYHHILGSLSFILIINHPVLLAVQALPLYPISASYLFFSLNLSYNFGVIALYLMILSFIFIVGVKVEYSKWKIIHKLLGVSFFFVSLHTMFISSDVSRFLPLRIWIMLFLVIGDLSAIYIMFLYKFIGPKYLYQTVGIERLLDIVNIVFKPMGKKIGFYPGQFVYIAFNSNKPTGELHPFSISSPLDCDNIRVSAKIAGDYTLTLPELEMNTTAFLYGPYGKFGHKMNFDKRINIWIAGGIGVTPFLSMLPNREPLNTVYLFYCTKDKEEAVFLPEIESRIAGKNNIRFTPWFSKVHGRLNARKIQEIVDTKQAEIYICGPKIMMSSLCSQFITQGVSEKQIHLEDFNHL